MQPRLMLVCHTPAPQDRDTSPPSLLPARRRLGQGLVKAFSYTFRRSPENATPGVPAAPGAIPASGPPPAPEYEPRLGRSLHRAPERPLREAVCRLSPGCMLGPSPASQKGQGPGSCPSPTSCLLPEPSLTLPSVPPPLPSLPQSGRSSLSEPPFGGVWKLFHLR